ncbi:MAG: phosphate butyryltransferase [Calditrichaeota bacterium]|nr:MAG: phosphate butyryltransferase [Calditrichota bacterium]
MIEKIESADQLIEKAIEIAKVGRKKKIAVAAAQDPDVIDAVAQAVSQGFIDAILVGDKKLIESYASEKSAELSTMEIYDEQDPIKAAHIAVKLASEYQADAIMKGFLPTSALLKTVLDKRYNLRGKNTLSHCAVLDIPGYHKLLNFTDGGMVVAPDAEQKFQIIENALLVSKSFGMSPVKVALSGPYMTPDANNPHTVYDKEVIVPRVQKELKDVHIEANISFDLATVGNSSLKKKYNSELIGDTDIFVSNSIEECNIVAKSLIQSIGTVFAGVIVGAKVPVSLVSRSDTVKNKKAAIAISCLLADYYQTNHIWSDDRCLKK